MIGLTSYLIYAAFQKEAEVKGKPSSKVTTLDEILAFSAYLLAITGPFIIFGGILLFVMAFDKKFYEKEVKKSAEQQK